MKALRVIRVAVVLILLTSVAYGISGCGGIKGQLESRVKHYMKYESQLWNFRVKWRHMRCYQYEPGTYRIIVEVYNWNNSGTWDWYQIYYKLEDGVWKTDVGFSLCWGCY